MKIDYDPDKRSENLVKHGLDFDDVADLQWDKGFSVPDTRYDYGEDRMNAFIPHQDKLYHISYTMRDEVVRVISFRRANAGERLYYAESY
jgi:uncharacterized DUF497 family protein